MHRQVGAAALLVFFLVAAGPATGSSELAAQDRQVYGYEDGQPFSSAVEAGNTIYFSGQLGLSDEVRQMEPGAERVQEEVRLILESFGELFDEVGVGYEDVVKATVYITDLDHYGALNEVYLEYFPQDAPARAAVEVSNLVAGAMVEIDFVAVRR